MANREKANLVLHPARLSILEALAQKPLTTQELCLRLPMVSQPSLYRHLKLLLKAGMVSVSETRPVRGVFEKVYRLEQAPHLSEQDLAGLSKEEHLRYYSMYIASLLQGFADYLNACPEPFDFLGDRVGYSELTFYANPQELDEFLGVLIPALQKLAALQPDDGRLHRKLAIISFPLPRKEA